MNRQDVIRFYPQFSLLLKRLRISYLILIAVVIILYSLSVYFLVKEQMVVSIGLASVAFLLFHFLQKLILKLVKKWILRDKENQEMMTFLEAELQRKQIDSSKPHKLKEYFSLLHRVMDMIKNPEKD